MQAFGSELRGLREAAGRPKYAVLAQRSGRSQTALSEAAGGQQFPTWETVEAFVRACNGDVVHWRRRWSDTAAAIGSTSQEPDSAPNPMTAPKPPGRVRILLAAAVAVAAITGAAIALWPSASDERATTGTQQRTSASTSAADGADPKQSRCAYDPEVNTLDSVELDQGGQPRGLVELRYAPSCGMAWSRFTPFPQAGIRPGTAIHVVIRRPADGRQASYQAPSVGAPVFGAMLRSTAHCVLASAWLGSDPTPTETSCFRGVVLAQAPD